MSIERLPADSPSKDVSEIPGRDGCDVIDCAQDRAVVDQISSEMAHSRGSRDQGSTGFTNTGRAASDRAKPTREMR
jgi:hypothetical protein